MKICKKCKTKTEEGKFCKKCGGELENFTENDKSSVGSNLKKKKKVKIKYCPQCKKQYALKDKFCSICANKLSSVKIEKEEVEPEILEEVNEKQKKKKKIRSNIAIILIILFVISFCKSCIHESELEQAREEAERQEHLANLKNEFLSDSQKLSDEIGVGIFSVAIDAGGQIEVFRKNAYGNLDNAVNEYRKKNSSIESGYLERKRKIEEIYNKNMLDVDEELKDDSEIQEINDLANDAINDFNAFIENTKSPSGTYPSYSQESNRKYEKAKTSHESLETRLKYVTEKNNIDQEQSEYN